MIWGKVKYDAMWRRFVHVPRLMEKGIGVEFAYWPNPQRIPPPGKSECQRRLTQIQLGHLRGNESFIPTSTRFAASGLYYAG